MTIILVDPERNCTWQNYYPLVDKFKMHIGTLNAVILVFSLEFKIQVSKYKQTQQLLYLPVNTVGTVKTP